MAGYTLTPVSIEVTISGFPTVVAHRVQIQHAINDYSRCDVSVIARNENEVVAFKELFPNLALAREFMKMTVSVALKSGATNTIKQFNTLWEGTLTGITPSMSPGAIEFTLHGLGGLFYSGTVSVYSPGMFPNSARMLDGAMSDLGLAGRIADSAATFKDIVDLFNLILEASKQYYDSAGDSIALNSALNQVVDLRWDLLQADLRKIKKVPGMEWPQPLAMGEVTGGGWIQDFTGRVLSNPAETFWTMYAAATVMQHAQLISIGNNVILSPAFWVNAPVNADKKYDPLNPPTNIIYPEDLLGVVPSINPFDAPSRVGSYVGQDYSSDGNVSGFDVTKAALPEASGLQVFPSEKGDKPLATVQQQEKLTGTRLMLVNPEHWLLSAVATAKFGRKEPYQKGDADTQKKDERDKNSDESAQLILEATQDEWIPAVRKYIEARYYKEVLASRSGAVQARLRLDCVPGLPCRVIAPWDAFSIDAYVLAVVHVISTTPEAANTVLQFSHARFVSEKVDVENPCYPGITVKAALPVFEAAARGQATGAEAGTVSGKPAAESFDDIVAGQQAAAAASENAPFGE